MNVTIDQVWECPKCGTQIASGPPARLHPPICNWGHSPTEMEQKAVGGMQRPRG